MEAYIILIAAFAIGMTLYGFLRNREINPLLSGVVAIGVAMIATIGYFAIALIASA